MKVNNITQPYYQFRLLDKIILFVVLRSSTDTKCFHIYSRRKKVISLVEFGTWKCDNGILSSVPH